MKENLNLRCYYQVPKILDILDPYSLWVFTIMFDMWKQFRDSDGWFYRTMDDLIKDTRLKDMRTIRRIINDMVEKGILSKRRGFGQCTQYRFNVETINQLTKCSKL